MKRGITATSAAILVAIIIILLGTVTVASYNTIQNAKKLVFALEISEIQEAVTKYYNDSMDNTYPVTIDTYVIDLTSVTTNSISQFDDETKDANNQISLYELNLADIGITDTNYGKKENDKDVYVVSKDTGKVYYLAGIKSKNKTYYALTQDLIDIKERNEKEESKTAQTLSITTDGYNINVLSSTNKEYYISNIKTSGNNIKTLKYEIGIIENELAKEYFKNDGAVIAGDRIKLTEMVDVTLYAEDINGNYVVKHVYNIIPEDFSVSTYSGEMSIENGLVIYDTKTLEGIEHETAMTTYDQYVWIPVHNINEFITRDGYENGVFQNEVKWQHVLEPVSKKNDGAYPTAVEDYNKMKASVEKYGGFYIARYEAGTTVDRLADTSNGTTVDENNVPIVLSQKDKFAYNYVSWGQDTNTIYGDITDNNGYVQGQGAVALSKGIYPEDEGYDVVSTLVYGVQWDAVMNLVKDIENPNVPGKKYIEDGTGMGWYSNNRLSNKTHKTGIDVDEKASNKVKNIYDMAGNVYEWTMETYGVQRVYRGGSTGVSSWYRPISWRGFINTNKASDQWRI